MGQIIPFEGEEHKIEALKGTIKGFASINPFFAVLFGTYDAYEQSLHDRYVQGFLLTLHDRVNSLEEMKKLLSDEWLLSPEGQTFIRKVFDCAVDAQLEDKHELFVNAFVHGIQNKHLRDLEKLKFVDMLRGLPRAALLVLAEMHKIYAVDIHKSYSPRPLAGAPQVSVIQVIDRLSKKFNPYLIESSISEMRSAGLFSRFTAFQWRGQKLEPDSSADNEIIYTEFTAEFVEFIGSS